MKKVKISKEIFGDNALIIEALLNKVINDKKSFNKSNKSEGSK